MSARLLLKKWPGCICWLQFNEGQKRSILTRWCRVPLHSLAPHCPEESPESSQWRLASLYLALVLREDINDALYGTVVRICVCVYVYVSHLWVSQGFAVYAGCFFWPRCLMGRARVFQAGVQTWVHLEWQQGRWSRCPARSPLVPPQKTSRAAGSSAARYDPCTCRQEVCAGSKNTDLHEIICICAKAGAAASS